MNLAGTNLSGDAGVSDGSRSDRSVRGVTGGTSGKSSVALGGYPDQSAAWYYRVTRLLRKMLHPCEARGRGYLETIV